MDVGYLGPLLAQDPEEAEYFHEELALVNALLADEGLPAHREPEPFEDSGCRQHLASFPGDFLDRLRRAYACACTGGPLPWEEEETAELYELVEEAASEWGAHLLCHSGCEGYFLPRDFPTPLEDAQRRGIAGGNVGSCAGLLRELAMVAPALGIRLEGGQLSDAEAARVYAASTRKEGPCWREQVAWLALWEKATTAMRHGAMLALT